MIVLKENFLTYLKSVYLILKLGLQTDAVAVKPEGRLIELEALSIKLKKLPRLAKLMLILISPVFAFYILHILYKAYGAQKASSKARVLPLKAPEGRIFFHGELHQAILSHENIHVLQNQYIYRKSKNKKKLYLHLPRSLDKYSDNKDISKSLRYLLDKDELEARFHELVVYMHARTGTFPERYQIFKEELESIQIKILSNTSTANPTLRHPQLDEDWRVIFKMLKYDNFDGMFFSNIAPELYMSLLQFYGLGEIQLRFSESLPSNFKLVESTYWTLQI